MRCEDDIALVLAALVARGLSRRKICRLLAQYMVFRRIDRHIPTPSVRFVLESNSDAQCEDRFRVNLAQIKTLHRMLSVPDEVVSAQRVRVPGLEALCIVLRRLTFPCRYRDMGHEFGRSPPVLCSVFNQTLLHIHHQVAKKMEFDERIFTQWVSESASSVYKKVGYLEDCIGFIDGTMRRIPRPGKNQREAYSGFKKCHCLKYQGVMLANGLLVSLYGPIEGRRHDSFMLSSSGLEDKILELFPGRYIYGDAGYGLKKWLLRPFQTTNPTREETKFNEAMSSGRVSVEWFFGEVCQYWGYGIFKPGIKLGKSPVGAIYIVSAFLTNSLMCARGKSKTSEYFGCGLPTLQDYLSNVGGDDGDDGYWSGFDEEGMSDDDQDDKSDCSDDDECDHRLTPAQRARVHAAMHHGPASDVVVHFDSVSITRGQMQCMLPETWLSDEPINAWIDLLRQRDTQLHQDNTRTTRSHFFSTFFYPLLSVQGYDGVRRWTNAVDVFNMDKIFVPVIVSNSHWALAMIFVQQKRIEYYDSLHGSGRSCLRLLRGYLQEEMVSKRAQQLHTREWQLVSTRMSTPQQQNGSDCGVFTCVFADFIAQDKALRFSQNDINYHRQRIVYSLVEGSILKEQQQ